MPVGIPLHAEDDFLIAWGKGTLFSAAELILAEGLTEAK